MRTLTRLVCNETMETTSSLIQLIEESIRKNWNLDAMTDYKGATLQYKDVARKIEKMHILFEHAGIKKEIKSRSAVETAQTGLQHFSVLSLMEQ